MLTACRRSWPRLRRAVSYQSACFASTCPCCCWHMVYRCVSHTPGLQGWKYVVHMATYDVYLLLPQSSLGFRTGLTSQLVCPNFLFLTGTSQLKQNAKAHSYICSICRTAFLCTTSEKMLRDHVAAKHDKATFEVRLSAERPICCAVY